MAMPPGGFSLTKTQAVMRTILEESQGKPFNVELAVGDGNYDAAYRYYLDIWGMKTTSVWDQITDQLFVVKEPNSLENTPDSIKLHTQFGFGEASLAGTWKYGDVTLSRYVHGASDGRKPLSRAMVEDFSARRLEGDELPPSATSLYVTRLYTFVSTRSPNVTIGQIDLVREDEGVPKVIATAEPRTPDFKWEVQDTQALLPSTIYSLRIVLWDGTEGWSSRVAAGELSR
jgi:hypothetical protein